MRNTLKMTKPEMKRRMMNAIVAAQSAYLAFSLGMMNAMAKADIKTNYTVQTTGDDPIQMFLGIVFYIVRAMGLGLGIYGIVGIATARSDGDSSQIMNQIGKLVGGVLLIGLPELLSGIGLIK